MFFLPIILVFFVVYFLILGFLFAIIQIGIIQFAFEKIGVPSEYVFTLLLFSLLGSMINIPVKRIESVIEAPGQVIQFFGWQFQIPRAPYVNSTIIAVNLGGAVIPSLLSLYLLLKNPHLIIEAIVSIIIVTVVMHRISRPVRGVGIVSPALLPPILAALLGLGLDAAHAPLIAYLSGTLGTLIGADLLNLKKIGGLGAPVASIGGAGTFDGIFLTGILAVLLTSFG